MRFRVLGLGNYLNPKPQLIPLEDLGAGACWSLLFEGWASHELKSKILTPERWLCTGLHRGVL